MLLDDRTAVIYGGGGAIGGAIARAFAREGATVHLAGRTAATLDAVADDIRAAGGSAETAVVDALDEGGVDSHADDVAARAGGIDISFNAISHNFVHLPFFRSLAANEIFSAYLSLLLGLPQSLWAARHLAHAGCAAGGAHRRAPPRQRAGADDGLLGAALDRA